MSSSVWELPTRLCEYCCHLLRPLQTDARLHRPISAAAFREVDLLGVFRYANTYPEALALFGAGRLPGVEKLVTTRFPLEQANEAFEALKAGKDKDGNMIMKLMVGDY